MNKDITTLLLACLNAEQVKEVMIAWVKRNNGWHDAEVSFEGKKMTVIGIQLRDEHDGKRLWREQLLVVDVQTGYVSYGRLRHLGLMSVDLSVIHNAAF